MMSVSCERCGADHDWTWEEAFDKFGFNDGDGMVMTDCVVAALEAAGYSAKTHTWGSHNVVITSIKRQGKDKELIPVKANVGYDDPRDYLPKSIIKVLDVAFDAEGEAPWN